MYSYLPHCNDPLASETQRASALKVATPTTDHGPAAAKPERHVQLGFDLVAVELGGLLDEEEEQAGQGEFESHSPAA